MRDCPCARFADETRLGVHRSVAENEAVTEIRFDERGLVPVVAQQWDTGEVLMVAWMDAEAVRRTRESGQATYWSRSRQEYWIKGATSGHVQAVKDMRIDCDGDTLLLLVDQTGAACHTGSRTCFTSFAEADAPGSGTG